MIVQEAGVAVGWPLGLGHDTTGWPLGLRLRLTQEDLAWPREPDLSRSHSCNTSEDSSSLDTMSTRSFFQDKSISLGTLIGLPITAMGYPTRQRQQQNRHDNYMMRTFPGSTTIASTSASPRRPNTANNSPSPRTRYRHRTSKKVRRFNAPLASNQADSPSSRAGWTLLSALSCARVPADLGSLVNESAIVVRPRVARVAHNSQGENLQEQSPSNRAVTTVARSRTPVMKLHNVSSPGRTLYDNITFEDESGEEVNNRSSEDPGWSRSSKEWNPLFASSPLVVPGDEGQELERSSEIKNLGDGVLVDNHHRMAGPSEPSVLTRSDFIAESNQGHYRFGTLMALSGSSFQDLRMEQEHIVDITSLSDIKSQVFRRPSDHRRNKAVSMFVNRMVCCRSTPTRGSSIC